jgi:hypothetical protein
MPIPNKKILKYQELLSLIRENSKNQDIDYIANKAREIVQIIREKYRTKEFNDQIDEAKKLFKESLVKLNVIEIII